MNVEKLQKTLEETQKKLEETQKKLEETTDVSNKYKNALSDACDMIDAMRSKRCRFCMFG